MFLIRGIPYLSSWVGFGFPVFYLKYFEEYELELRLGQSYVDYRQSVPFLLPKLVLRKR